MPLIFISHAIVDKSVINDLFDLLQTGCDLRKDEIFCSSVEGAGIETGADFLKWIQDHLEQSKIVILFLTPNYYASKFCLAEMGAAWSLKKEIFPILIPDMKRDAGLVLTRRQTAVVDETGLDDLRDTITKHYSPAGKSTSRWSLKKEQFLRNFRAKVKDLPQPKLIDRAQLEEEKQKTTTAMELNNQLTIENKVLQEQIAALEKLKDKAEVTRIKEQFLPREGKYEKLVKEVYDALSDLSVVEVRCIYASIIGELWQPGREDYKDYEDAIKKAMLSRRIVKESDSNGDMGFTADESHPKLRPVFGAIEKLDHFIAHDIKSKEAAQLEEKHKLIIDINNIEYWEKILFRFRLPA
jgi:regulator of replication initiation timing